MTRKCSKILKNKEIYSIIARRNKEKESEGTVIRMKIWKYTIVIVLITFLLLSFSMNYSQTKAAALSNIVSGADSFIQNGQQGSAKIDNDDIHNLSDTIYNILLIIGTIVAMIVGAVLGIQFMTGSVEAKSKVKESLIPFVTGCVVIFGAFAIWKLVITILQGMN